tara:strand:- start:52686 stop:53789 length:1104 start_codon:yes stop_codon:yes gene_type:complete
MQNLRLIRLNVFNYKNLVQASLSLHSKVNAFFGENAQGKTNFLDAIFTLGNTKSYLTSVDADSVMAGEAFYTISTEVEKDNVLDEISIAYQIEGKKRVKKGVKDFKRLADYIGYMPVVIISPYDSNIISGLAEIRRKFLDSAISFYNREYLTALMQYNKILKQKNSHLKSEMPNAGVLEVLNLQLAKPGAYILKERQRFVDIFNPVFSTNYSDLAGVDESPELTYLPSILPTEDYETALKNNMKRDMMARRSTLGIHKDDLDLKLKHLSAKKFASQGQQKSLLIALKLSKYLVLKDEIGVKPILLLDDIFDKLDKKRVQNLMDILHQEHYGQLFISHTSKEDILDIFGDDLGLFQVKNGKVSCDVEV